MCDIRLNLATLIMKGLITLGKGCVDFICIIMLGCVSNNIYKLIQC